MAGFSGVQAFSSGFRLIGREPLAVAAWAGAYLVLAVLPQLAMAALMWPDLVPIIQAGQSGAEPDMDMILGVYTKAPFFQLVSILASVVSASVLLGAIYRAVLEPEDRRYLYLRFSGRELAIGLTMVVLYIMLFAAVLVLVILCAILMAVAHSANADWAGVIVGLAAFAVLVWLMIRFSLATPLAFAQGRFVVFESWALTRGQAGKMFLVLLGLLVVILVIEGVLIGVGVGLFSGIMAGAVLTGMGDPLELVSRFWPWIAVGCVVGALLSAAVYAILAAPFADIYAQLTADRTPAA